jgi:hypothetical protein
LVGLFSFQLAASTHFSRDTHAFMSVPFRSFDETCKARFSQRRLDGRRRHHRLRYLRDDIELRSRRAQWACRRKQEHTPGNTLIGPTFSTRAGAPLDPKSSLPRWGVRRADYVGYTSKRYQQLSGAKV